MWVNRRRRGCRVLLAACVAGVPLFASAADRYWVGGDGFWELPAHWSATAGGPGGAGQPQTGDSAFISSLQNLTVERADQSAPAYAAPGMALLQLDNAAANLTTLNFHSTNALVSQDMLVGVNGKARVLHTAGNNTVANQLLLGVNAGSVGTYDLSGGTVSATNVFIGGTAVGRGGLAELNITGGTFTASGIVKNWNDLGGITVDGGTLNAGALIFNDWYNFHFRKGTINLTGGDGFGAGDMEIGSGASTNASTLNLNAGSFEIDGRQWVIKFFSNEPIDSPLIEHATMTLARKAGIQSAETRVIPLLGEHAIAVGRFDRDGERRIHSISAGTALRAAAPAGQEPELGYPALAQLLRRAGVAQGGANEADSRELFRRIPDIEASGEPSRLLSGFINGIKHLPVTFTPGGAAA